MSTAVASRSRYIPWLFVAGFAIVIAVNGVMVWFAVGSFSGLYTDRASRSFRDADVATGRRWGVQAIQPGKAEHDAGSA